MDAELLLCDVGNTTIKIGLANRDKVLTSYSLPTDHNATADSFGLELFTLLKHARVNIGAIKACVASSVVPPIDPLLSDAAARYLNCPILFVPDNLPVPIKNDYDNPSEVGADRLVVSYAARKIYPDCASIIIVDYGTATTFDCVSGDAYYGGLIFLGPAATADALASRAAKLPYINLRVCKPEISLYEDTVTSIQHGIVYGFVSLTEGLCARLKNLLEPPVKIIGAGGFASTIAKLSPIFDRVEPMLMLSGLRQLYYEQY